MPSRHSNSWTAKEVILIRRKWYTHKNVAYRTCVTTIRAFSLTVSGIAFLPIFFHSRTSRRAKDVWFNVPAVLRARYCKCRVSYCLWLLVMRGKPTNNRETTKTAFVPTGGATRAHHYGYVWPFAESKIRQRIYCVSDRLVPEAQESRLDSKKNSNQSHNYFINNWMSDCEIPPKDLTDDGLQCTSIFFQTIRTELGVKP